MRSTHYSVCLCAWNVASEALSALRSHDDEIRLGFFCDAQNLLDGFTNGDLEIYFAVQLGSARHQRPQLVPVAFFLNGQDFMAISLRVLEHVQAAPKAKS